LTTRNKAQANFGTAKFRYPCRTLHKPSDFLQNLFDVYFEPIVHTTAIGYSNPICSKFGQVV